MENAGVENWRVLASLFPEGWEKQATETGAVERLRGFGSAEDLLRTLLLHVAMGYSLRETAVLAKAANLSAVSDVALMKRGDSPNKRVLDRSLAGIAGTTSDMGVLD